MPNRQTVIATSTTAAGIAAFLYGIVADGRINGSDLRSAGLLVLLLSLVPAWRRAMRTTPACAYELGYKDGKEQGRAEGRRIARPVAIQPCGCDCEAKVRLGLVPSTGQE